MLIIEKYSQWRQDHARIRKNFFEISNVQYRIIYRVRDCPNVTKVCPRIIWIVQWIDPTKDAIPNIKVETEGSRDSFHKKNKAQSD